ncbi:Uncharacterised protein [Mycobacteroides abscessus subsp. abscessus]|nr:Uncharacterised protein [Mycobacteroides abscessus subsp. abscessus]
MRKPLQRREFGRDVAPAARQCSELSAIAFQDQPIAVPFAFKRPFFGGQTRHRPGGRQHRRETDGHRTGGPLILHPVHQPLLAVGSNQRVPPGDSLAVEGHDDLTFLPAVGS